MRNAKDFYAGLLFCAAGGAFAWGAFDYDIGRSARMGPGYFPLLLGLMLAALGTLMMWRAQGQKPQEGQRLPALAWRPLLAISAANVLFGLTLVGVPRWHLPPLGLMPGIVLLTLVASLAGSPVRRRESLALALLLAVLSYVVFVWLLRLQLPVWPSWGR